jgi:prevent-host-death family protein
LEELLMREVGAYEAKTRLSQLLDDVATGETIIITRHGVPVAQLAPASAATPRRSMEVAQAIAAIRELRRGLTLGGLAIRDMIEDGRR